MKAPKLYDLYFIQKQDERRQLFQLLSREFSPRTGVYPGSFVHITPAFYIPEMLFIDNDRRINSFFSKPDTLEYIRDQSTYDQTPAVTWMQEDYAAVSAALQEHFDIMFSFYAGFISRACRFLLRPGGILVANNSHGDASLALADQEYALHGVLLRKGEKFSLITEDLDGFFTKPDHSPIDMEKVLKRMTGERFAKSAYAYVFQKTNSRFT